MEWKMGEEFWCRLSPAVGEFANGGEEVWEEL